VACVDPVPVHQRALWFSEEGRKGEGREGALLLLLLLLLLLPFGA